MDYPDQRPFWGIAAKIHKITWLLDREADRLLRERLTLSFPQFGILMAIRHHPAITQKTIADAHGQTEGAISKRINDLVKRRLVVRGQNPDSRREYRLSLTAAGERHFHQAIELLDKELAARFTSLSRLRQRHFDRSLDTILDLLCMCDGTKKRGHRLFTRHPHHAFSHH